MYINPFLAGVMATVFAEIALVLVVAFMAAIRRTKK